MTHSSPTRSTAAGFGIGSGTAGQCWCQKGDPTSIPAPGNLNPGWKPRFTSTHAGLIFSLSRELCDCQSQPKQRACIWLKGRGERRKSPFFLTGKSIITLQKLWHYRRGTKLMGWKSKSLCIGSKEAPAGPWSGCNFKETVMLIV